jgi:putative hydrolase
LSLGSRMLPAKGTEEFPLTNTLLGELLCSSADEPGRGYQQRRALRRAGRTAFRWHMEAGELVTTGHSLTELQGVGPWLERVIGEWLAAPPPIQGPPPIRRNFLSRVDVDRLLAVTGSTPPVRGDLQTHTWGSDGTASVCDMAQAAAVRGWKYLAITDHSKGLRIANGMTEAQLGRQGEDIRRLNEEFGSSGFRVLRGVEMNLSPRGEGDMDPQFLEGLDLVLGAFHSRLRLTEDQTERYLAALRNPNLHVLAHPRGRIFNFRLGLQADWPRVFASAREHNRAIEIDGYPDRQDLDVELLRLARDLGTLISFGSDAHAPDQLSFLDFSIAAACQVGIPASQILNCKTADELLAWAAEPRP